MEKPLILLLTDDLQLKLSIENSLKSTCAILYPTRFSTTEDIVKTNRLDLIIIEKTFAKDILSYSKNLQNICLKDHTPLALITGKLSKSFFSKAKKSGILYFLNPMFDEKELHDLIANVRKSKIRQKKAISLSKKVSVPKSAKDKNLTNKITPNKKPNPKIKSIRKGLES